MLLSYARAFGVTLLVEVPVYVAILTGAARVRRGRAVLMAVGVNVATHPALWWSLRPLSGRAAYPQIVTGAEIAVCVVEWALLVWWTRNRTPGDLLLLGAASVAANAASTLVGALLGA
jgi:hypothetical protein